MLKRKIDSFIRQFFRRSKNALLITGARQIGKTFSVREFGKNFKSFVEINFVENQDAVEIFRTAKSSSDILLRLSAMTDTPLIKGETLIFFDEVQKCPEIVTAIKFLVEEGSYRYVLSGSLLGVELRDLRSVPVGYLEVKDMYPLDFEEFLICNNVSESIISHLKEAFYKKISVDDVIHAKLLELFRLYLVVGGMPAAVSKYLETNNLQEVVAVQREIIRLYKWDISQYDYKNKLKIEEIFDLIPSELNAKNKRFILKSLNRNAKFAYYEDSFLWLKNAGVALPVYNVEEPKVPLLLAKSRNLFKLFQSDVGLLAAQYSDGIQLKIIMGQSDINFGAIYENAVAQELAAHDFNLYYFNSKKQGELDFVVEKDGMILPIEVKSGKDYAVHRALTNILENSEYNIKEALVLSNANIKQVGKILYAPIYMVMLIEKKKEKPLIYKIDLSAVS
ncbi:ATP-binding protein [Succinatimonas hippei]|uniref:ATP-binding protein n=1 Tax=Succinatimonas hippei TaxID=626938 RepID=UPI00255C5187|nr:AAA family ATPase [Succinatimonas hippei]